MPTQDNHKPSQNIPKADRVQPLMGSHQMYMNFCFFSSILFALSSQRMLGENSGGVVPDSATPPSNKVKKHNIPLTYKHKTLPVLNGLCGQTIRKLGKRQKSIGDIGRVFGWWGRPRWTPQYWVMEVELTEAHDLIVSNAGISQAGEFWAWDTRYPNRLAELDYIDPPTGEELKNVLFGLHKDISDDEEIPFQILRWDPKQRNITKIITITEQPQPIRSLFPFGGDA